MLLMAVGIVAEDFSKIWLFMVSFLVVFGIFVFTQFSNHLFNKVITADRSSLRTHSVPGGSLHVLAEVAFAVLG